MFDIQKSSQLSPEEIVRLALQEDLGTGDHTSRATIPEGTTGKARLLVKENGILCGIEIARMVFRQADPELVFTPLLEDGTPVCSGDVAFTVEGCTVSILSAERVALNFMQRLSGIATYTRRVAGRLEGLSAKVLDTRKTTPLLRGLEKYAVRVGGGSNHRFGLFDMVLIKDNHVDFAGGIPRAISGVRSYLAKNQLNLMIEIETRNLDEVIQVLETGGVDRIMLDNFTPALLKEAVNLIGRRYETEASGRITIENIREYGETGVDFISVGALTHHLRSLDLSLKAVHG